MVRSLGQIRSLLLIVVTAASSVLPAASSPLFFAPPAPIAAESCHQAQIPSRNPDSQQPAPPLSGNHYSCCVAGHDAALLRGCQVEGPFAALVGSLPATKPVTACFPSPLRENRTDSPSPGHSHPIRI